MLVELSKLILTISVVFIFAHTVQQLQLTSTKWKCKTNWIPSFLLFRCSASPRRVGGPLLFDSRKRVFCFRPLGAPTITGPVLGTQIRLRWRLPLPRSGLMMTGTYSCFDSIFCGSEPRSSYICPSSEGLLWDVAFRFFKLL